MSRGGGRIDLTLALAHLVSRVPPPVVSAPEARRPTAVLAPLSAAASGAPRSRLHTAAVWGPPLVVALLIAVVLAAVGRQQAARRWVVHTRDVLAAAAATLRHVQDAETGQRGYLLTGEGAYRAPYDAAHAALATDTARLRALTRDNAVQQHRLDALTPLVAAKVAELDATVRLRAAGNAVGALVIVRAGHGRRLMDEIRGALDAVTTEEERLLAARQGREDQAAAALVWTVLAGGLTAAGLALLANRILAGAAARVARAAQAESARAEGLAITQARLQHQRGELQATNHRLETHAVELEREVGALRARAEQLQSQLVTQQAA